MHRRCDITCKAPVTSELLYQIREVLIPALVKYATKLYSPVITAVADASPLPCHGAVGTGCSLGVDSMHTIASLHGKKYPGMELTHLVLNNVGAYTNFGETREDRYEYQAGQARLFAEELGYKLIINNSNIAMAFPQFHLFAHWYVDTFAVYALRKLWRTYFYASAGFGIEGACVMRDNHKHCSYEIFLAPLLSIPDLQVRIAGCTHTRFDKQRELLDFEPTYRYLNVCFDEGRNCGKCGKCVRTLYIMEALPGEEKLKERFGGLFDLDPYLSKGKERYYELYMLSRNPESMLQEAYAILNHHIGSTFWRKLYFLKRKIRNKLHLPVH